MVKTFPQEGKKRI